MHVFVIIAYKTNVEQLTMYYGSDDMCLTRPWLDYSIYKLLAKA
jgi:hypothetical protein